MITLRPPDGRVFVEVEEQVAKQYTCVIKSVGDEVELEVGQRVCVMGRLDKVELQDIDLYSVNAEHIVFIYE